MGQLVAELPVVDEYAAVRRTADQEFADAYPALFRASMGLANRLTRDPSLSEDIAAETLARAYAKWSSVRSADNPTAWVLRVTANLVIDTARRTKVAAAALPLLASGDDLVRIEDQVTIRMALVSALGTLPKRQREALVLRYIAGLEEPDLSTALGASPSSVRTHVQRGLANLREKLPKVEEVQPHGA